MNEIDGQPVQSSRKERSKKRPDKRNGTKTDPSLKSDANPNRNRAPRIKNGMQSNNNRKPMILSRSNVSVPMSGMNDSTLMYDDYQYPQHHQFRTSVQNWSNSQNSTDITDTSTSSNLRAEAPEFVPNFTFR